MQHAMQRRAQSATRDIEETDKNVASVLPGRKMKFRFVPLGPFCLSEMLNDKTMLIKYQNSSAFYGPTNKAGPP
jgi:hypothetical protein